MIVVDGEEEEEEEELAHLFMVKRDLRNFTKVLIGFPVINNESKEIIAFVREA